MEEIKQKIESIKKTGKHLDLEEKWHKTRGHYNRISNKIFNETHHIAIIKLYYGLMPGFKKKNMAEIAELYQPHLDERVYPNNIQRQIDTARKLLGIIPLSKKQTSQKEIVAKKKKHLCCICLEKFIPKDEEYICWPCKTTPEYVQLRQE